MLGFEAAMEVDGESPSMLFFFWTTVTLISLPRPIFFTESPEAELAMDDGVFKDFEFVLDFLLSGNVVSLFVFSVLGSFL
jgi:hypothetical protein